MPAGKWNVSGQLLVPGLARDLANLRKSVPVGLRRAKDQLLLAGVCACKGYGWNPSPFDFSPAEMNTRFP